MNSKLFVLAVFVISYALALSRKVKLSLISLTATAILILAGTIGFHETLFTAIQWDVLGVYWGFMLVSFVFMKSHMPDFMASKILTHVHTEKYALITLCCITAILSSFMQNVGVVLIMAPVALATAKRFESSIAPYLIAIAISSNVVTTVTMVADPPALILAMKTGMRFFDFYWFQGKPGLGTLTLAGVITSLLVLLYLFRHMNKKLALQTERIQPSPNATILFFAGVIALAFAPEFGISPGWIGFATGLIAMIIGRNHLREMIREFDWDSFLFVTGIFVVVYTVEATGILTDFTRIIVKSGIESPGVLLALLTWMSVAFSSFIDNVPYTLLMISVCKDLAALIQIDPWAFLYGMLVGTGIGGNITPVGATANIFACGIIEKQGHKVSFGEFFRMGLPFSVAAVLTTHILIHWIWLEGH